MVHYLQSCSAAGMHICALFHISSYSFFPYLTHHSLLCCRMKIPLEDHVGTVTEMTKSLHTQLNPINTHVHQANENQIPNNESVLPLTNSEINVSTE